MQDFGGSQDLHQLLKVAAKSQRPDVPGLKRAEQLRVFMRWADLCMVFYRYTALFARIFYPSQHGAGFLA